MFNKWTNVTNLGGNIFNKWTNVTNLGGMFSTRLFTYMYVLYIYIHCTHMYMNQWRIPYLVKYLLLATNLEVHIIKLEWSNMVLAKGYDGYSLFSQLALLHNGAKFKGHWKFVNASFLLEARSCAALKPLLINCYEVCCYLASCQFCICVRAANL